MVCEKILGNLNEGKFSNLDIDYLDIEWHEAFKKIHKKTTKDGIEVGIRMDNEILKRGLRQDDALFPIGGYSHSYGLEPYIQKGIVIDEKSAEKYIGSNLRNNLCYTDFLIVRFAYEYAKSNNLKSLIELEEIVEASKTAYELREASRKLGSRFIKTVINLDINYESDIFKKYIDVRKGSSINHACVYGILCAAIGVNEIDDLNMYLYS